MLPKYHALAAGAAAVPLARAGWRPLDLALFLAGAVLIDGDHYLGYVWETGDISFPRAYASVSYTHLTLPTNREV